MFGGRYRGTRWYIDIEHRKAGPNAGELSDAPCCCQCNTASRARADAAAAALHEQDATYTRHDAATLGDGRLALMGRASGAAAARHLALARAATVTRSADDAALEKAQVPTPARDRGDGVERFDPAAVPGSYDAAARHRGTPMKSCQACSAKIPIKCMKCKECGEPCTKKRKT